MEFLREVFWFVVTLGILIPIHEYGHYRVARACGVKVLRFSVGFGRVLLRRNVGPDRTEFALSMLPLGGYVKMLDEREGGVAPADLPRAFNRRPLYQRALIVAAGPAANLVLAVVLYGFVQWYGQDMPLPVVGKPAAGSLMADAGLQAGDRIVASAQGADASDDDFRKVRSFEDVSLAINGALIDREPLQLRVTRDGGSVTRTLTVALDTIDPFKAPAPGSKTLGLGLLAQVGEILPDGAAAGSGLKAGDLVLRVDGKPIDDTAALRAAIQASGSGGVPKAMRWDVDRAGTVMSLSVTARAEPVAGGTPVMRAGIAFLHERVSAGPLEALALGATQTWRQAIGSLRMFGHMLTGHSSTKALGGPGTIAEVASASARLGFVPFLNFLAMISLGLGVLNLLPIPMLDGGMLLYYLFEGATGRPVSELWQIWLQRGGALILLLLMTLALSNDVVYAIWARNKLLMSSLIPSLMRPVAACVIFAGAALPFAAQAIEPFQIRDIRVEGLQRTDPGSVFSVLPFRVGDGYSDEKAAAALRALFATGLFKDVRIDVEGDVVVVIVDERATIASVNFLGTKEFDKDTLVKALKDSGIGEGLPFDKAIVDRAEQEIKRQYLGHSLYAAEVVTTVTPLERNRVNVTFKVSEGDVAHIRDIHILGSKAFSESKLIDQMDLTTGGWLTWYTKSDRYSRTKLNADLEKLRAFYLNKGYLEFDITSTQVTISPDKQTISVTITVTEGQPYIVTAIRLEGNYLGREAQFKNLIQLKPGANYHGDDVTATTRAFTDLFGTYGYAFAHVEPHPEIDRKSGQVVVVLSADPGRRAYVRRVNLSGNTITRDEVIRREFRQFESAWYDGSKIKLSRDRVDRLGFFSSVDVDTNDVPGAPDQVDLTVNVVEKPTGNLTLAAGYSQADKVSLTGSIKKENVFGSGNYVALDVSTAHTNKNLSISETNPYFTDDGISRTFDIYYRTSRPLNTSGDAYAVSTPGADIRFGLPYSEFDTVFVGIGAEQTHIGSLQGVPNSYYRFVGEFGAYANSFPITAGWARDERDSGVSPTSGRYMRVNTDFSLFGDVQYARLNGQVTQYLDLGNHFSLGINAEVGYGAGLNGKSYPVFKNFYGGGLGSVRVFEQGSLGDGTVDPTGAFIGGSKKLNINNELYIPVPGADKDKSLRLFTFLDAGNVWTEQHRVDLGSLRASAGLGLSWTSPVGPFKLSYGLPIRKGPHDRIQRFQFQVGTAF